MSSKRTTIPLSLLLTVLVCISAASYGLAAPLPAAPSALLQHRQMGSSPRQQILLQAPATPASPAPGRSSGSARPWT